MNTIDTKGIKDSYLFPLLLSCFFPINIISLVTHPMNCLWYASYCSWFVPCCLNVIQFCLWCPTLNSLKCFCFLPCSSPCRISSERFFVLTDPNYNTAPASEMDANELEPKFLQTSLSVNPILITKNVQVCLFSISQGYKAMPYLNVNIYMCTVLSIKFIFIFPSLQCSHETAYWFDFNIWQCVIGTHLSPKRYCF